MAQGNGRVTCPKCGANNFDTVAACYRCSAPLGPGSVPAGRSNPPRPGQSAAPTSPLASQMSMGSPMTANGPVAYPAPAYAAPGVSAADGDPRMARRAAVLLALTVPFLGLPIGWAFMMMEDQRRQTIGRFCATWSLIGLVFHLLLMFVGMASLTSYLPAILKASQAVSASARSGQGAGDR